MLLAYQKYAEEEEGKKHVQFMLAAQESPNYFVLHERHFKSEKFCTY